MTIVNQNIEINKKLSALYIQYGDSYLKEYIKAFQDTDPPCRINEFGIIDVNRYYTDNPVLFIAKETNSWSNEDYESGILFRDWMQGIANEGVSGKGHVQKHPTMWYNLGRWAMAIHQSSMPVPEIASCYRSALYEIGTVAFTNMNKVRGGNTSKGSYWQLANADITGELLREEIYILNPAIVVCCGTYSEFRHHIPEYAGKVIDMPHPGARISREKMLCNLREQMGSI